MVEVLLSGIVLGFILSTLLGLFIVAFLQYKRGNELNFNKNSTIKTRKS